MNMSPFTLWLFRKLVRDNITQGPHHQSNLEQMYRIIQEEAQREFYEDNAPTLNGFLDDCYVAGREGVL